MSETKTLSSQTVFAGRAVSVRIDTIQTPSGRQSTREIVEHADCVAIIALDAKQNILLERQFREAIGKELLEIPAGGIDPGEDPAAAVAREMQEETGYLPRRVQKIGGFYATPGYGTEYLYLYLATDLVPSQLVAEDTESIQLVPTPVSEIPNMIASGAICDAKSVAGLLTYIYLKKRD